MREISSKRTGMTMIEHVLQAALVAVIAFLSVWMAFAWFFRGLAKVVDRLFGISEPAGSRIGR